MCVALAGLLHLLQTLNHRMQSQLEFYLRFLNNTQSIVIRTTVVVMGDLATTHYSFCTKTSALRTLRIRTQVAARAMQAPASQVAKQLTRCLCRLATKKYQLTMQASKQRC